MSVVEEPPGWSHLQCTKLGSVPCHEGALDHGESESIALCFWICRLHCKRPRSGCASSFLTPGQIQLDHLFCESFLCNQPTPHTCRQASKVCGSDRELLSVVTWLETGRAGGGCASQGREDGSPCPRSCLDSTVQPQLCPLPVLLVSPRPRFTYLVIHWHSCSPISLHTLSLFHARSSKERLLPEGGSQAGRAVARQGLQCPGCIPTGPEEGEQGRSDGRWLHPRSWPWPWRVKPPPRRGDVLRAPAVDSTWVYFVS